MSTQCRCTDVYQRTLINLGVYSMQLHQRYLCTIVLIAYHIIKFCILHACRFYADGFVGLTFRTPQKVHKQKKTMTVSPSFKHSELQYTDDESTTPTVTSMPWGDKELCDWEVTIYVETARILSEFYEPTFWSWLITSGHFASVGLSLLEIVQFGTAEKSTRELPQIAKEQILKLWFDWAMTEAATETSYIKHVLPFMRQPGDSRTKAMYDGVKQTGEVGVGGRR